MELYAYAQSRPLGLHSLCFSGVWLCPLALHAPLQVRVRQAEMDRLTNELKMTENYMKVEKAETDKLKQAGFGMVRGCLDFGATNCYSCILRF